MPNLYVDPYVLACPTVIAGEGAFRKYAQNLAVWTQVNVEFAGCLRILEDSMPILHAEGLYPLHAIVDDIISKYGIRDIQAKDVYAMVNGLLSKSRSVDKELGVREVILDNVKVDPSDHLAVRAIRLKDSYEKIVCLMILMENFERLSLLVTSGHSNDPQEVISSGDIVDYELEADSSFAVVPSDYSGIIIGCESIVGLFKSLDPVEVWLNAKSEGEFRLALAIEIYSRCLLGSKVQVGPLLQPWKFHPEFLGYCKEWGFCHERPKAKMLLRSCAETVLKENLDDTHHFRETEAQTSPQRIRPSDSAGAWRRDVNDEYHIHYWETSSGPEFAFVGAHNYYIIPL